MDWAKIVSVLMSYEAFVVYESIIIFVLVTSIIFLTKERRRKKREREAEIEERKKRQLDNALNNVWRR